MFNLRLFRRDSSDVRESPQFLYVEINTRCNLKCKHCLFWLNEDADRHKWLSRPRRAEIIGEFADLGGQVIVSCGGEPMLDFDDYFDISTVAHGLGLRFFSVTNGTQVTDDSIADRIIAEGPDEITVSVDGLTAEVHDHARGIRGSFDQAVRALSLLLAARRRAGSAKRVYAMKTATRNTTCASTPAGSITSSCFTTRSTRSAACAAGGRCPARASTSATHTSAIS